MSEKVRVCGIHEIDNESARRFEVNGKRIAIVRIGHQFYAIGDTCSHANISLAEGDVYAEIKEIECWKHGSTFSLETGAPMNLPATKSVPVYDVEVVGEDVMVTVR